MNLGEYLLLIWLEEWKEDLLKKVFWGWVYFGVWIWDII